MRPGKAMPFRRAVSAGTIQKRELGIIGIGVAIGIVFQDLDQPMNLWIEIHPKPIAIPSPIATPTPKIYSICPAVRDRPKLHILGVVDCLICLRPLRSSWFRISLARGQA